MLITIIITLVITFIILELLHFFKPTSPLQIHPKEWSVNFTENEFSINGYLEIINPHPKMEVMIPDLKVKSKLLGTTAKLCIDTNIKVISSSLDKKSRKDNYWEAYIVKSREKSLLYVQISIKEKQGNPLLLNLESLWIDIFWINYGPFGRIKRHNGFAVPIDRQHKNLNWINIDQKVLLLPIPTHILGSLDNPQELLQKYCSCIIKPGDIITIGETPLAIMQGRYIFPDSIQISFLARILCNSFHPTSSLATACGMQSLIDIIGPSRVLFSWFIAALFKFFKIKGIFYRLAGSQARLIDDITGTTPPYDQTIVLGPTDQERFCREASNQLGIDVAIVDVNDLGRVKILATSNQSKNNLLYKVLTSNPAGNADQHTPLVLIRTP